MDGAADYDDVSECIENDQNIVDDAQNVGRRKRVHRHTPQQIQELENFFKECHHPNVTQMANLGERLNLEAKQIKYWFQNKRTLAKNQNARYENINLRQQQSLLHRHQDQLRQAMILPPRNTCGNPKNDSEPHLLKAENIRLKQELDQLYRILTTPFQSLAPPLPLGFSGSVNSVNERQTLLNVATTAMNELLRLGEADSALWRFDRVSRRESLNHEMYQSAFNNGTMQNHGYVTDSTRETGFVVMLASNMVETFVHMNKWANVFAPMVSVVSKSEVLLTGPGGSRSGSLHLIEAELQVISPLVPRRKVKFLRYCKEMRPGTWIVVDVTPNQLTPDSPPDDDGSRRLPSGLIIEDMNNLFSRVTWIEQAQYDASQINQVYQSLIGSGVGLGAKRWLATLQRHCDSIRNLSYASLARLSPELFPNATLELVKLARRMTVSYYSCITGSSMYEWETIPMENEEQNMRISTRKIGNEQAGEPTGIVLSASTTVRLPVNQKQLFDFLNNPCLRNQWDVLTANTSMVERIKIVKTGRYGNTVTLSEIVGNGLQVLQEVWNDESGAVLVYAPVENSSMAGVMNGANSEIAKLLPCGFSIMPDGDSKPNRGRKRTGGGCLMTLGHQILASCGPTEPTQETVNSVKQLLAQTIDKIKIGLPIQT